MHSLLWLLEWWDCLYPTKRDKPSGTVNDKHWVDNGEWK